MLRLWQEGRKKKTLIKQNKKNPHKVGVLCMTFCCSGYGVHVSAAPSMMMKSDEDSGLDVNRRRRWDVNWCCSWTTGWSMDEINEIMKSCWLKIFYHDSLASFVLWHKERNWRAKAKNKSFLAKAYKTPLELFPPSFKFKINSMRDFCCRSVFNTSFPMNLEVKVMVVKRPWKPAELKILVDDGHRRGNLPASKLFLSLLCRQHFCC